MSRPSNQRDSSKRSRGQNQGNRDEPEVSEFHAGLFFGCAFSLIGALLLGWFACSETFQAMFFFQETECEFIESETRYRVDRFPGRRGRDIVDVQWKLHVVISYKVKDKTYEFAPFAEFPEDVLTRDEIDDYVAKYPAGTICNCRYARNDPSRAVLMFHKTYWLYWLWWSPIYLTGVLCTSIGIFIVVYASRRRKKDRTKSVG